MYWRLSNLGLDSDLTDRLRPAPSRFCWSRNGLKLGHAWPTFVTAFLASLVEFVKALTIILPVGTVRGWRGALVGSGAALGVLLAIVVVLGTALTLIPLKFVQLAIGTLLLLFGMRWLRKAILRSAGLIPLDDEEAVYAKRTEDF